MVFSIRIPDSLRCSRHLVFAVLASYPFGPSHAKSAARKSKILSASRLSGPFHTLLQQIYPKNFRISVFLDFPRNVCADKSKSLLVSLVFGLFLTQLLTKGL